MTKYFSNFLSKFFIILFIILNFSFLLSFDSLADNGIVPCNGLSCEFSDLYQLVNNVITFALYKIAVPLVVVFTIWGGFTIMTARENASQVTKGKDMITAAVIGLVISLAAWLIVREILTLLTCQSFIPWNFDPAQHC